MKIVCGNILNIRLIYPILLGTFFEYYDYMLYMQFIFIINPIFFPSDNFMLNQIISMFSFCISFFVRPLGAIVFGYIGDVYGRKRALYLSMGLMSFSSLIIGVLPEPKVIGFVAPGILVCCRLLQGLSAGGESSGANVFLFETAKKNHKCFTTSLLNFSCWGGALAGSICGFIFLHLKHPWAWRIPFILGSFLGVLACYIRKNVNESEKFLENKIKQKENIINNWKNILSIFFISLGSVFPIHIIFIYINQIYKNTFQYKDEKIFFNNILITFFIFILQPIFGFLGDKVGSRFLILLFSILFIPTNCILFLYSFCSPNYEFLFLSQMLLAFLYSGISGPVCSYLVALFPINYRCRGIGLSWSLGIAISSCIPFLSSILTNITNKQYIILIFSMLTNLLCCFGIFISTSHYKDNNFFKGFYNG